MDFYLLLSPAVWSQKNTRNRIPVTTSHHYERIKSWMSGRQLIRNIAGNLGARQIHLEATMTGFGVSKIRFESASLGDNRSGFFKRQIGRTGTMYSRNASLLHHLEATMTGFGVSKIRFESASLGDNRSGFFKRQIGRTGTMYSRNASLLHQISKLHHLRKSHKVPPRQDCIYMHCRKIDTRSWRRGECFQANTTASES